MVDRILGSLVPEVSRAEVPVFLLVGSAVLECD
jgi:hypothetical protein